MKEELNLVEILKNVPEGTELYSSIYGNVVFIRVDEYNVMYPIIITMMNCKNVKGYTKNGQKLHGCGECTLFPSKTQRDWSKFKVDLKEGTKVMCSDNDVDWHLRIYKRKKRCSIIGKANEYEWKYVVPVYEFDIENIESNINRSI